jgi:spermidine synthase
VSVAARAITGVRTVATYTGGDLTLGLAALFFVSGACGLVYQVLWVRMLSLAFGVTIFAVTVVLASFMAGLALGSLIGGRIAERLRQPLRAYGMLELAIATAALATPFALAAVQRLYPVLAEPLGDSEAVLTPIRVLLAFGLLVVPTALMGATLPIVLKSSLARSEELAGRIGLLYTANTVGAIAGALLAGFWLIGELGISRSIQLAAAANAAVGLGAILLQHLAPPAPPHEQAVRMDRHALASPRVRRLTLAAVALSGACSFAYEVIWTRMLALVLDTSIYAFVTMLSTVLLGIALGSAAVTPLLTRRWHWPLVFAGLEAAIALGAIWAVWAVAILPDLRAWLEATPGLGRLTASPVAFNFVVAAITILPSTLLIGATFPVAARIYTAGAARPARRLGQLYSANVFGAIFGAALGGFVLLPLLGTQASLLAIALVSLGLAGMVTLAAILDARGGTCPAHAGDACVAPTMLRTGGVVATGLALFACLWLLKPDLYQALFAARFPEGRVLWFAEGLETTVAVVREPEGHRTLYTNSRGQANDEASLVNYHHQLAHLPLLVRPEASDVLIVGLGSGSTAGSILQHDGVRVEVVELSDAVVGGATRFGAVNYGALDDPNLSLKIGDGRNHLLTTPKKYDLITNDTIQPYDAGSTNLYSAEYYRLARNALTEDGIVAQWILPGDDYQYKMTIRTFLSEFPHATLWLNADLLIGSRQPITLDLPKIARRFESAQARAAMAAVGFDEPATATLWFVADRSELEAYVGPGPILTDDRPALEYFRSLPGRGQGPPPDLYSFFSRDPDRVIVAR